MACALRISRDIWGTIQRHLRDSGDERGAYLLAPRRPVDRPVGHRAVTDLLVTRAIPIPDDALSVQNGVRVEVAAWLTREVLIACFETGLSLVDMHSHPFADDTVSFSGLDVENMRQTHTEFLDRMPAVPPVGVALLVLGQASVAGAYTGPDDGTLRMLDRLVLLGDDDLTEVTLCRS
ncbi:hypothetical protein AB0M91_26780 [Micromonospora rifamycinica]|uniref:hypothetical protein n=1 Tax=Micromonospora rifamycinica TaxID=291594 RepID=UPI00342F79F0